MGYGLMYKKGKKTYYSTNTGLIGSWSDDIERAAEIVQEVNAVKAAKSMYKDGFEHQIHVVYITKVPMQMIQVPMPEKKTGFVIVDTDKMNKKKRFYSGAKKPQYFRYNSVDVVQSATTFKTEKEAQKTLDAMVQYFIESADYEDAYNARHHRTNTNWYREHLEHVQAFYQIQEL